MNTSTIPSTLILVAMIVLWPLFIPEFRAIGVIPARAKS